MTDSQFKSIKTMLLVNAFMQGMILGKLFLG